MSQTIAEKVLSKHSRSECSAGDTVVASVDFCMAQDGTSSLMIGDLEALGFEAPKTTNGMALVLDHNAPCPSADVARIHSRIRGFASRWAIPLYDVGEGVCHQVIPESGRVLPGDLVVGADSHTCTYGALNVCSTGMGSADVAASAFTGTLWFRVPESFSISVEGALSDRVSPKDVILAVIGELSADGATYKSVEFKGSTIDAMDIDGRMTVANMAVEMGAKFCPFHFDDKTREWFAEKGIRETEPVASDDDAEFESSFEVDAADIVPKVSMPHKVDSVRDVADVGDIEVQQIFLGTCTNGRLGDLRVAASLLRGRKVKSGLRFIVAPASRKVFLAALEEGIVSSLVRSGAVFVTPGCGPCVGTHAGVPSDGDNVLSTANRNFKGRMGNNDGVGIYLCSPETAAASAITGRITDPREL